MAMVTNATIYSWLEEIFLVTQQNGFYKVHDHVAPGFTDLNVVCKDLNYVHRPNGQGHAWKSNIAPTREDAEIIKVAYDERIAQKAATAKQRSIDAEQSIEIVSSTVANPKIENILPVFQPVDYSNFDLSQKQQLILERLDQLIHIAQHNYEE